MQCRQCGTEIADKAMVCFSCGAGTSDPVRKAVPIKPRRNPWLSLAVAAVLLLIALYLGFAGQTAANPDPWQTAAGILVGAALMVVILWVLRRRR